MNGSTSGLDGLFIRDTSPRPASLPALEALFQQAAHAALDLVVIASEKTPDQIKTRSKRRHDMKAALRTLHLLLKALQGGYRFEGDDAAAKIDAVARAYQVLEKECRTLDQILTPDSSL
jgi:hypothetical protein